MAPTRREAQAIITRESHARSPDLDDRTAFRSGPNEAARMHDWWLHYDDHEAPDTQRNIALLTAYDVIDGPKLWAIGQNGFVEWVAPEKGEPYFTPTDAGRALIAG